MTKTQTKKLKIQHLIKAHNFGQKSNFWPKTQSLVRNSKSAKERNAIKFDPELLGYKFMHIFSDRDKIFKMIIKKPQLKKSNYP